MMEATRKLDQKLENNQIQRLCGISKATFYRSLRES
jgi:predicted DNA-binding transcriptional regulator AlpA